MTVEVHSVGPLDAKLYLGDCREVMPRVQSCSIDTIITDPPYPRKFQYLYEAVAIQAKRLLKPGGSLLAIVPHYALPEILYLVGRHLKYRWTHCMWQMGGPHPRMAMGIEVVWKPIVWWVKGSWPQGRGFVVDGFANSKPEKGIHEWQQSLAWAMYCMKFVPEGGTVLDPLMGSGTVGIACFETGHKFIGVESDSETYSTARFRLDECTSSVNRAD